MTRDTEMRTGASETTGKFNLSSLLLAVSLLVHHVVQAEDVTINSPIRYPNEAEVTGDLQWPKGEAPFPAVVMMHG